MSAIRVGFAFEIDVGAPANINARISHLAESETASLKNAQPPALIINMRPRNPSALKFRKGDLWRDTSTGRTCVFKARSNF